MNPDFYQHKRAQSPNLAYAAAMQSEANLAQHRQKKKEQYDMMKGGVDLYGAYQRNKALSASNAAKAGAHTSAGGAAPVNMAGGTAASTAAQGQAPNLAAKGGGLFSKAAGPIGMGIGGATGYANAKAEGRGDLDVAAKTAGGMAPGALMMTAAPLAAMGPPGWAGIAGLAALSLYGMLG